MKQALLHCESYWLKCLIHTALRIVVCERRENFSIRIFLKEKYFMLMLKQIDHLRHMLECVTAKINVAITTLHLTTFVTMVKFERLK